MLQICDAVVMTTHTHTHTHTWHSRAASWQHCNADNLKTLSANCMTIRREWLVVPQRVEFNVSTLVKVNQAPTGHATGDCCLVTDAHPRRLRSADTRTILASRTRTNFGDRAISAAGPRVWNYLLTDLRQPFQTITESVFVWYRWDIRAKRIPL